MKRVTGIGGVFFIAKDPAALGAWYKTHLGIDVQDWGGGRLRLEGRCRRHRHHRLGGGRRLQLCPQQGPVHDQLPRG